MEREIVSALLDAKLDFLNTIASTSMSWWVSSVVFCATLLGAIWSRRVEVQRVPFKKPLGVLLYFFFASIVLYGVLVTQRIWVIRNDVQGLLAQLHAPTDLYDAEFFWLLPGHLLGTTSFVIFMLVWHVMWRAIREPQPDR